LRADLEHVVIAGHANTDPGSFSSFTESSPRRAFALVE
jgi:hypothetical protein